MVPQTSSQYLFRPIRLGLLVILLIGLLGILSVSVTLSAPNGWLLTARDRNTANLLPEGQGARCWGSK